MAKIYFDCVNANGGIYGHPIEYSYEDVSPDPAVLHGDRDQARRAGQGPRHRRQHELLECDVNGDYYAEHGYHPIIAGVAPGCFLSDQWSAVNMGPYYSNLGGAQAAVRAGATGKLVVASPDQPGMDFNNSSVEDVANIEGLDFEGILEAVPIADPAGSPSVLVQAAGEGGGVVLNFTGPDRGAVAAGDLASRVSSTRSSGPARRRRTTRLGRRGARPTAAAPIGTASS